MQSDKLGFEYLFKWCIFFNFTIFTVIKHNESLGSDACFFAIAICGITALQ